MIKSIVAGFIFVVFNLFSNAQSACNTKLLDGYIIDGHVHTLNLEDVKTGKIFLSFFKDFQYRFVICSKSTKKFNIALYDIGRNLLFSSVCDKNTQYYDWKFKSSTACYIEITLNDEYSSPQQFEVYIGYKEGEARK